MAYNSHFYLEVLDVDVIELFDRIGKINLYDLKLIILLSFFTPQLYLNYSIIINNFLLKI